MMESARHCIRKTKIFMDTIVDIQVVYAANWSEADVTIQIERAFDSFRLVENTCSRFEPSSELMRLCAQIGMAVPVSPILFEPLKFAVEIAAYTDGVFDPAIGRKMELQGFDRNYVSGERMNHIVDDSASYRDILIDEVNRMVTLKRSMVLDLGAVAKGFAIDLASVHLQEFEGFIVNAGGDLYVGGSDVEGNPWRIGIQHPLHEDEWIDEVELLDMAICTSGGYERKSERDADAHHIIHVKTGVSPTEVISCSVIAPFAMLADGCSTALMLLGMEKRKEFIEEMGVKVMLLSPDLDVLTIGDDPDVV